MTKLTKASQNLSLTDATDMVWHKTVIKIYPVTEAMLSELTAGYNSLHLVFLGIFAGAAISLFIAYEATAETNLKPYYLGAFLATFGLSILFGIFGIGSYVRATRAKNKLYREAIPLEVKA